MPNFIKRYVEYIKDNPRGYWFKRKLYGWGWAPATREGWLVVLVYIAIIIMLALRLDENATNKEAVSQLIIPLVVITAVLIWSAYVKGEKPKWMWGLPKKEDHNEKDRDVQ